jgi:hypothetical protein
MEPAKVALLAMSPEALDLPPRLKRLADDPEFWMTMELTPEDSLSAEQLELIRALGVEPPPQAGGA